MGEIYKFGYNFSIEELSAKFCPLAKRAFRDKKFIRLKDYASGLIGVLKENPYAWLDDFKDNGDGSFTRIKHPDLKKLSPPERRERTDTIYFYVDLYEPCCVFHALTELQEEFLRICKKKYMQECEMRSYFLEGIQIDSEDSAKIEISILTGT